MLYATFLIGFACFAFELLLWLIGRDGAVSVPPASASVALLGVLVMACSAGFIELKAAINARREERK